MTARPWRRPTPRAYAHWTDPVHTNEAVITVRASFSNHPNESSVGYHVIVETSNRDGPITLAQQKQTAIDYVSGRLESTPLSLT
jgi:hypothetical protein